MPKKSEYEAMCNISERAVGPPPNPHTGISFFVACPRLLIQNILQQLSGVWIFNTEECQLRLSVREINSET